MKLSLSLADYKYLYRLMGSSEMMSGRSYETQLLHSKLALKLVNIAWHIENDERIKNDSKVQTSGYNKSYREERGLT